jgi:hypothetical protein
MIELFFDKDMQPTAKGLTPGQPLRVYMPDGKVWVVTRFGQECVAGCIEPLVQKTKGKT